MVILGWMTNREITRFNDISYETQGSRVTTGVHWALNQQTTSASVCLHTALHNNLPPSVSACFLCSVIHSWTFTLHLPHFHKWWLCMLLAGSVQDLDPQMSPPVGKESWAPDDFRECKKKTNFLQRPEPWDHDKLKSVAHESSIKGSIWKYITLQLCSSCHKRRSAMLMT